MNIDYCDSCGTMHFGGSGSCPSPTSFLTPDEWQEVIRILLEPPDKERFDWGPSWDLECKRRADLAMKIRAALP